MLRQMIPNAKWPIWDLKEYLRQMENPNNTMENADYALWNHEEPLNKCTRGIKEKKKGLT